MEDQIWGEKLEVLFFIFFKLEVPLYLGLPWWLRW